MTEIESMRQEIAYLRKEIALLRAALGNRQQNPYTPIPVIGPGLYPPYQSFPYPSAPPNLAPPWIVTCESQ